jgi:hypothetical protein
LKGSFINVALTALCVLILLGLGLSAYFVASSDRNDVVCVELGEGEKEVIAFDSLSLLPGEEEAYKISLRTSVVGVGTVSLDFAEEGSEEGRLKDYLYVRLIVDGETLCDDLLSNVLSRDAIAVECELSEETPFDFLVVYYLPVETGNEVQGATAAFTLSVWASNKE